MLLKKYLLEIVVFTAGAVVVIQGLPLKFSDMSTFFCWKGWGGVNYGKSTKTFKMKKKKIKVGIIWEPQPFGYVGLNSSSLCYY
jgi:hypothetical protein